MPSQSKIGRLPRPLQIELNRRLQRNESSTLILAWLNPLPEVQAILQAEFAGVPLSKQNLSEWRTTGLAKWATRQEILSEILDVDGDAAELDTATQGRLADRLATALAGRYARLINQWDGEDTEDVTKKLRVLHSFTMDVSHLRRWDHSAARVKLEQVRTEASLEPDNEALFMKFEEWAQNIGVQDYLMAHYETPRDRENAKRKLLDLPPLPAPGVGTACPHNTTTSDLPSDHQPPSDRQSVPLCSISVNGGEGRGEEAFNKPVPPPSQAPMACAPTIPNPPASSTPSPEANPTSNPLNSLTNSPATARVSPTSVKHRRPPAPGVGTACPQNTAIPSPSSDHQPSSDCQSVPLSSISVNGGEGRGEAALNKNVPPPSGATIASEPSVQNPAQTHNVSIPNLASEDQPSSDRQSAPLSSISVNGGEGRGEAALIKNAPSPSQATTTCALSVQNPAQSPASTPEPPEKSPHPPVCKDRCEESGFNFCRKCGLTPADIHNWPLRSEEMRRDIIFRARDRRRGRF